MPVASLDEFDLQQLIAMIVGFDAESVALLESYMDRRFPALASARAGRHGRGAAPHGDGR